MDQHPANPKYTPHTRKQPGTPKYTPHTRKQPANPKYTPHTRKQHGSPKFTPGIALKNEGKCSNSRSTSKLINLRGTVGASSRIFKEIVVRRSTGSRARIERKSKEPCEMPLESFLLMLYDSQNGWNLVWVTSKTPGARKAQKPADRFGSHRVYVCIGK